MLKLGTALVVSSVLLSGCILSKDEYDPTFSFPTEYAGEKNLPNINEPMSGILSFWNQFEDPVLTELVGMIIDTNFDIGIALEKINEIRAMYRIEAGKLWPEIDYGASWLRTRRSADLFAEEFMGPLYQNLYTIGLDSSWELDFFGKRRFGKDAAW